MGTTNMWMRQLETLEKKSSHEEMPHLKLISHFRKNLSTMARTWPSPFDLRKRLLHQLKKGLFLLG
jgi:hypothetical protein